MLSSLVRKSESGQVCESDDCGQKESQQVQTISPKHSGGSKANFEKTQNQPGASHAAYGEAL
jgi:hypothetical protein